MVKCTRVAAAVFVFSIVASAQVAANPAQPLSAAEIAHDRAAIRHALDVPDKLPALQAKTWSTFSPMKGVLAERVTYSTADGMIVPAIVYRPDPKVLKPAHGRGKLPAVVIVNGHGGDKFSWYAFYSGLLFARAGAVVLTYDPIGEGERNAHKLSRESPSPHDVYPPTPAGITDDAWHRKWGRHVAGLMQVDLYQAVRYLEARPEVDAKRIAVAGYSMGSFVAGIEGAWDTLPHAVLLSGGGVFDGPGEYYDSNKLPCQGPPYRALAPLGDRGAVLFALNAERGPMLVMNGEADKVMDIPHHNAAWFDAVRQRALALVANNPAAQRNMFTNIFFPGVGHRPSWVTRQGVEWLERQLHFPLWPSEASIDAQGTTHISTWIRANDVDISKNYIVETREGGLDAVGTGFPAIPRADLMVLPEADWQRLEGRLTFKAWAASLKAALNGNNR
jgi:dienelactone hydrolase